MCVCVCVCGGGGGGGNLGALKFQSVYRKLDTKYLTQTEKDIILYVLDNLREITNCDISCSSVHAVVTDAMT